MYIHTPGTREASGIPPRQHPKQIRFAVSLESAAYYNWIDDPHYMCNYESEATYRSCSQVHNNKPWPEEQGRKLSKREVFQRYKFCVAMENSISFDYITEKIWDALSSAAT
ncbi:hypothetical protein OEZ85_004713 [Tetradesmus obliquus]|uniref:Fucosyltransferase n=1 Tax=Tetradesmus obliquus TaxID=3088 RepID=A0ABY8UMC4_TETOB|nr:hypothetical protein OEZ85_004713 [Tetradesmus obliquus]